MNTDAQVVVGYDGTPDSLAALAWAARMASLRGATVVATTIIDPRETPRGVAWPESWWEETEDKARKEVAPWPGLDARFERHVGHLVPALVEAAQGGSMLVVGSKGHGLVGEILLGSVSQSTARHAALPVVVVRPAHNPEADRIVVGADGSESSARAIEFACETARLTGQKVVALRAWYPATVVTDRYGYLPMSTGNSAEEVEAALRQKVEEVRTAHPDVTVEGEVYSGAAERALVEASSNASLVVVGSRGRSAVAGALMGSVSRDVLHQAHCPVAVVH
ncbi:MAG TPA: universal stress protein [Nocardioides sp.]|jgi:nucleotide-binding universal stress UspA family protein|nr:universal stress protein [Nocardioides sp.]